MIRRSGSPVTMLTALLAAVALVVACNDLPTGQSLTDGDVSFHHRSGHDGGPGNGGPGGDDDGGDGGVLFDFFDETADNGLKIADANHGDLFNDGGRWLDIGFAGNDGLPDVDLNYDGTQAGSGCVASNTTQEVDADALKAYLTADPASGEMVSGGLTVDKKNATSTEHRVGVQFTDGSLTVLVALKGNLGSPITVTGDASADPTDLVFDGGTVRVRAKLGGSSSTDPVLDCPHLDFVQARVDRQ